MPLPPKSSYTSNNSPFFNGLLGEQGTIPYQTKNYVKSNVRNLTDTTEENKTNRKVTVYRSLLLFHGFI
jgi:hypothetical protein